MAKSRPQLEAELRQKQASIALGNAGLRPSLRVGTTNDHDRDLEYWSCFSSDRPPRIDISLALPGRWFLKLNWRFWSDPFGGGEVQMFESSISLNVESGLTDGLGTRCLVRYDVDHRPTRRTGEFGAAHLNVLQPGDIEDHAHYPLPGAEVEEWPLTELLRFFQSDLLRDDLANRLPT